MDNINSMPILIPIETEAFWDHIRVIIREEVTKSQIELPIATNITETVGLTEKPLYKIKEVCSLFKVTKPTIYAWIKHGKLKKVKIRSRVYFRGSDIRQLISS